MAKIAVMGGTSESIWTFRRELILRLLASGHDALVIACDGRAEKKITGIGAKFRRVSIRPQGINPFKEAASLMELARLLKYEQPDFLFLYAIKHAVYGSLASLLIPRCRVFSFITGLGYVFSGSSFRQQALKAIVLILLKLALLRNKEVFFLNPDDAAKFRRLLLVAPERHVVLNGEGVDLKHFSQAPLPEGPVSFLLISRMLKQKGVGEFAASARILKSKYPEARFVMAGPFDKNPGVISESAARGWEKEGLIEYAGEVADVRPLIMDSSVYVLPSYYGEGIPRSILEAMAMGRPIITCDLPGCRETVEEGRNGFFVLAKNSSELANVMERFIIMPDTIKGMGKRSRLMAEQKFDSEKVNDIILRTAGLA